jgi:riboflavin synthase
VVDVARSGSSLLLKVRVPQKTTALIVTHGSVGVDGVSLTISAIPAQDAFQVALIDHTLSHTNLADLTAGDEVHVEADMIARHVRRLLAPYLGNG